MFTSKRLLFPSLAAGALLFSSYSGFGNLITNGGFETITPADDGNINQAYHVSGTYDNVTNEVVGSFHPWIGGREAVPGDPATINSTTQWFANIAPANLSHPAQREIAVYQPILAAPGTNYAVELHSTQSAGTSAYDVVFMEQTVGSLIVGRQYTLTFKFADTDYNSILAAPGNTSNQHPELRVLFTEGDRFTLGLGALTPVTAGFSDSNSSVTLASTSATFQSAQYNNLSNGNVWHDGKVEFIATSTIETVRFLNFASSLGNNMSIDEVDLELTPEPATLGAAALLLGGIGFFERKRLKSLRFFKKACS